MVKSKQKQPLRGQKVKISTQVTIKKHKINQKNEHMALQEFNVKEKKSKVQSPSFLVSHLMSFCGATDMTEESDIQLEDRMEQPS